MFGANKYAIASTNLLAIATKTHVITHNTSGSPEAIDESTGLVIEKGNMNGHKYAIEHITSKGNDHYRSFCRTRAVVNFNKDERYLDYVKLFESLDHS